MTIDRTRVRRGALWAVPLVAMALAATACGEDDDSSSSTGSTGTAATGETSTSAAGPASSTQGSAQPTDVDAAGVLRFGSRLTPTTEIHFDPIQLRAEGARNIWWMELIYGTLLRQGEDGTLEPWMADEVEIVDPQTVRISLRPGITFTDGAAYDAEAVKVNLMRTRLQSATPAIANGMHNGFKSLTTVDVVDPLTVVAHLDQPIAAVFVESLASIGGFIVSPKQIAENPGQIETSPVGAGPYVFEEYRPEELLSVRKNADFWDTDRWQLGGIDFVHTPNGAPQVNGLLAGTIDISPDLPIDTLDAVEADGDLTTEVQSIRYAPLLLCTGKPPFDNPAVRQALQIGVDRESYNELVYAGLGEPEYGALPEDHPAFDSALKEQLSYDPDAAKKLLSDAGLQNVSFDLYIISTLNMDKHAEVLQSQLGKIGITVNIVKVDNAYTQWIEPQKSGALLAPLNDYRTGGYIFFAQTFTKGGGLSYCGSENPEAIGFIRQAAALPADDPKSVEAYRETNREYVESAFQIPLVFEPIATTWNTSRVGGTPTFIDNSGQFRPRFDTVYIKK